MKKGRAGLFRITKAHRMDMCRITPVSANVIIFPVITTFKYYFLNLAKIGFYVKNE